METKIDEIREWAKAKDVVLTETQICRIDISRSILENEGEKLAKEFSATEKFDAKRYCDRLYELVAAFFATIEAGVGNDIFLKLFDGRTKEAMIVLFLLNFGEGLS